MVETITLRTWTNVTTGQKTITVERWPRVTRFDYEVLAKADPAVLRVDGSTLTMTVANGRAVYELDEPDSLRLYRTAYLVSARLTDAT